MDDDAGPTAPSLDRLRSPSERMSPGYGCRLIVLVGSVARGETRPRDLDPGVLCAGEFDPTSFTNDVTRAPGVQDVDVCDLGRADPPLLMLAARGGVPLFEARPGEFDRFASLAARLASAAGLRNRPAHEYDDRDDRVVFDAAHSAVRTFTNYVAAVEHFLSDHGH